MKSYRLLILAFLVLQFSALHATAADSIAVRTAEVNGLKIHYLTAGHGDLA